MAVRKIASRFARYGTVGVLANLSGYAVFLGILALGTPPVLATGATYLLVVSGSYWANRHWTFRSRNSHLQDAPRYAIAYGLGFAMALGAMQVLSSFIHPAIAQFGVIFVAAVTIYASLEFTRFGRSGRADAD